MEMRRYEAMSVIYTRWIRLFQYGIEGESPSRISMKTTGNAVNNKGGIHGYST